MVLNKLRQSISPFLLSLGKIIDRKGIPAIFFTIMGGIISGLSALLFAYLPRATYFAAIALLIAGIFDMLDGSVARASNKISKAGSLSDSTVDRIAEIAIFSGIAFGGEASPALVAAALGASLLVSYLRAKGESLGVPVSGLGVGERAERVIVLIAFSFFGIVSLGLYLVLILASITVIQRFYKILRTIEIQKDAAGMLSL